MDESIKEIEDKQFLNGVQIITGWGYEMQENILRQHAQIVHPIMGKMCQVNVKQDCIKIGLL